MDSVAKYRELAQDCVDMAERAKPQHRETLRQIAEMWLRLAADELNDISRRSASVRLAYLRDLQRK